MASGDVNKPWRNFPYSPGTMALGAAVVVGGIWYYMTYINKKSQPLARVPSGTVRSEDTPRK
ncbi:hypothetical protein R3W88_022095 [Solanum pinnatisectum]|uniref:Uncharacterized protein n=1 Tax=Solanum pinnatisectum TaxID=50273 RepID=A0AAV9LV74_9SOLN|nr:hypothetical protein R3W88_022095 [Solanum pinnatisectum]